MRKEKDVTIVREGRDKGKTFHLKEMPAAQTVDWAYRALGAMTRTGLEIPQHIIDLGIAGVVAMGLKALFGVPFGEAKPLLDELIGCVTRIESAIPQGRPLVENDIEEPLTISQLHSEVLELHTGFSVAAYLWNIWEAAGNRVAERSLNTQTSTE